MRGNRVAKIIDNETIHVFDRSQFDWHIIRNSGQIFRTPPCEITAAADKVVIKCSDAAYWFNYFDLQTDYNEIKEELAQFAALRGPIAAGGGIRILRQPFREAVIAFIISANNNIKRFSKTIEQIDFANLEAYTEQDFTKMGCGYRAPYLVETIQQLKSINYAELETLENAALRKKLMTMPGVGPKVADCIMLFAFHRLNIAPVDVHIRRAIEQLGKEQAYTIMNHRYAGVAQQYLFYFVQHLKKELK